MPSKFAQKSAKNDPKMRENERKLGKNDRKMSKIAQKIGLHDQKSQSMILTFFFSHKKEKAVHFYTASFY